MAWLWGTRNKYRILVGNLTVSKLLGRLRKRQDNNIKHISGCEVENWIEMNQDSVLWQIFIAVALMSWFLYQWTELWTGNETCSVLWDTLPLFSSTIHSCNSSSSFALKSSLDCCSTQTDVNAALLTVRDSSSREFHRLWNRALLHTTDAEINSSVNENNTRTTLAV